MADTLHAIPEGPEAPASPTRRITFSLHDALVDKVSRLAERAGMTRSEYLARLVADAVER